MGLLDFLQSPETQLGIGLLAAGGPRTDPNQTGLGVRMQDALGYVQKQKDDELRRQQAMQLKQMQDMQLQEMRRKFSDQDATRGVLRDFYAQQGLPQSGAAQGTAQFNAQPGQLGSGSFGVLPPAQGSPDIPQAGAQAPAQGDAQGVTPKAQAWQQYKNIGDRLAANGQVDQAQQYYSLAEKFRPKYSTTPKQMMVGGKLTNVLVSEDGSAKTLDGYGVKPDMVNVNLGGTDQWVDKNTVSNGQTMTRTQTPDSVASNELIKRGQDMVDRRKAQELQGAEEAFTPEAIANAAARYNIDGTLPPMGMGKAGTMGRAAILNQAAILAQKSGLSGDEQRTNQLGNKANAAALSKLQQQQTMVGAFEKNANKNADMALALSGQVDRTGVPIFNAWMQAGQKSITGNAKLAEFHASNETFVNEYAKIMSGSMGNTAVSDSARNQAKSLLSTAQTPEAYAAVVNRLRLEMQNRMAGFEEEKAALRGSMSTNYKPPGAATAPAAQTTKTPVASGMFGGRKVIKYSDGSTEYAN